LFNSFSDPHISHYNKIVELSFPKKITIYISISGGWTYVALSCHLCTYAFINSWFPLSMTIRLVLPWAISRLNLYYFKNASVRSFHLLILTLSSLIYQLKTDLIRLSWKK
jgi:hypothetical protein